MKVIFTYPLVPAVTTATFPACLIAAILLQTIIGPSKSDSHRSVAGEFYTIKVTHSLRLLNMVHNISTICKEYIKVPEQLVPYYIM